MTPPRPDGLRITRARLIALAFWLAALAAGLVLARVLPGVAAGLHPEGSVWTDPLVLAVLAVFVLACAVPFVPGAEIGFALLVMLGPKVALLVWLATVAALGLAYAAGRYVPADRIAAGLEALGLARAARLVRDLGALPEAARGAALAAALPGGAAGWLARHRLLALAVLFNLPGNSLVGGGGGIAFATGASRLVRPAAFVALVALAVSPVPILVVLLGP
jgi:hypothetical protein